MNDERVKYKIADRAFSRRAATLSRLTDCAHQEREVGLMAGALEASIADKNWALAEKLVGVLIKLRESQQKSRERAGELVDVVEFRHKILAPLLDALGARLQEALCDKPGKYEETIDLILDDIGSAHPRLLLEGPKQ